MTGDEDEERQPEAVGGDAVAAGADGSAAARPCLRAVTGPLVVRDERQLPPPVRLRREFKGLTVADLTRDDIVHRLPGRVQSALAHIERGDLAAAERALPGHFAKVLAGPGHRSRKRWCWLWATAVLAVVFAASLMAWLSSWLGI